MTRGPSIGESDTVKCLVPDNWSEISRRRAFSPGEDRRVDANGIVAVQYGWRGFGKRGRSITHDCCGLSEAIAAWSHELNEREIEIARAGIVEKSYSANEFIFMRGDDFEYWTGVVTGLARMGIVSRGGKAASFAGLTTGAWFGEGTVLKNEPRRYDVVALRDTRLAMMDRADLRLAVREQCRVQPFPGRPAQRAPRPVHRAARIWPHAGCDRASGALDGLLVQSHPLSGPDPSSRNHAGGDRGAVRYLPAKRQPVPKAAGKGRVCSGSNMAA